MDRARREAAFRRLRDRSDFTGGRVALNPGILFELVRRSMILAGNGQGTPEQESLWEAIDATLEQV